MVAMELNGNYIDAEHMKACMAQELTNAYHSIFKHWRATIVIWSNWHLLNNEVPEELKQAIRENGCRVKLTPADMHRQNLAE